MCEEPYLKVFPIRFQMREKDKLFSNIYLIIYSFETVVFVSRLLGEITTYFSVSWMSMCMEPTQLTSD